MGDMFCFQCQQTAHNTGCEGSAGVCGKKADTANYQDDLVSALIGLARAVRKKGATEKSDELMLKGLFTTITNVNFYNDTICALIDEVHKEKEAIAPQTDDYDVQTIWDDNEDIRSLKSLILFGLKGMAAYAYHSYALGYTDPEVQAFFYEGMEALGEEHTADELLSLVLKTGDVNYKCMAMLDRANTETYGTPVPTTVPLTIEKGPFIVVSGHDLHDLKLLLEQTKDKGINIYTHSEMLPAHGYPELKKYPHLAGNFGTAWQSQQKEFDNIPAPILFTTNCLMPQRPSYQDRVYTTSVVGYKGLTHITGDADGNKDFTPIIEHALRLGGYEHDHSMSGINGGHVLTTGFAHAAVLSHAEQIINSINQGHIRHIFLVGGCDGAHPGRNYYTDFVKQTPMDSLVLTLACGKYRFNDLDLGEIDGIPRILDMGQCNDSYSAIKVALALADAFDCSVNDLPLTLVLSWYEQKAVCILLTLLSLGIRNMYLGPTLPAFMSETVVKYLVDTYNLQPITAPEQDMDAILKRG